MPSNNLDASLTTPAGNACHDRRRAVAWLLLVALVGCSPANKQQSEANPQALIGIDLKLLVVDDQPMADTISRLRAQWQADTGGTLSVDESNVADFEARVNDGKLTADVVIYPPRFLGRLAERQAVLPLKPLSTAELRWNDIFELPKTRTCAWGVDSYAVPLGEPVLLCAYRADVLAALRKEPPRTWQDYQQLAALLDDRKQVIAAIGGDGVSPNENWRGACEPLGKDWAASALLARAASYAKHANHYSALFDIKTMQPLIASPPFVRALDELIEANKHAPVDSAVSTPLDAWRAISEGRVGMAICWPSIGDSQSSAMSRLDIAYTRLPGSREVYNPTSHAWEQRGRSDASAINITLAGIDGRVGSIVSDTKHADASMRLLAWLASEQWGPRISAASEHTAPYRESHVPSAEAWLGQGATAAEAKNYAETVASALRTSEALDLPRIPGAARYLAALDEAVRKAIKGEATPKAALDEAAQHWRAITDELGSEQQRTAYQRSLLLEP